MRKQILIVQQDAESLALLTETLSGNYELIHAENFIMALDILSSKQASRISAVLVDLTISRGEGSAFLASLINTPGRRDLPVLVIADTFEETADIKGLQRGTYDYLQKPLNNAVLSFRLRNLIERGEYAAYGKYRYLAEYDPVCAIYNRDRFYSATRHMLDSHANTQYTLARFDIDRFKVFNDLFGVSAGDRLLAEIGKFFRQTFDSSVTFGRLEADHFVFCVQQDHLQPQAFIAQFQEHFLGFQPNFIISPRIGIYRIDDPSLDVSLMCDRALMALRSAKSGSAERVGHYDESMRERILEEQALIGDVNSALKNEEFESIFSRNTTTAREKSSARKRSFAGTIPKREWSCPGRLFPFSKNSGSLASWTYTFGSAPASSSVAGGRWGCRISPFRSTFRARIFKRSTSAKHSRALRAKTMFRPVTFALKLRRRPISKVRSCS